MITVNIDGTKQAEEKIGNVHVYRVGKGKVREIFDADSWSKKSANTAKEIGFDATWAIMASYNGFAALAFKIFKPRIPFILTFKKVIQLNT